MINCYKGMQTITEDKGAQKLWRTRVGDQGHPNSQRGQGCPKVGWQGGKGVQTVRVDKGAQMLRGQGCPNSQGR